MTFSGKLNLHNIIKSVIITVDATQICTVSSFRITAKVSYSLFCYVKIVKACDCSKRGFIYKEIYKTVSLV